MKPLPPPDKAPQKAGTYVYHVNVRTPPPPPGGIASQPVDEFWSHSSSAEYHKIACA